jgi:hypothetical protein
MHLAWPNVTLAALLAARLWYAYATNGKPVYEMSGRKGALWVGVIAVLLWQGGFWG